MDIRQKLEGRRTVINKLIEYMVTVPAKHVYQYQYSNFLYANIFINYI